MKRPRGERSIVTPERTFLRRRFAVAAGMLALTGLTVIGVTVRPASALQWIENTVGISQSDKSPADCIVYADNKYFTDWDIAAAIALRATDRTANDIFYGDIGNTKGNHRSYDEGYIQSGDPVYLSNPADCGAAAHTELRTEEMLKVPDNH